MENNKEEYVAMKINNKEWGLYGKTCNCIIVFGTKKEIQERAERLNELYKLSIKNKN